MFHYPPVKNISRRSYAQNMGKKKEMMKIYTKRFFYILHPRIIIIFYTRYKFSLKIVYIFQDQNEFV